MTESENWWFKGFHELWDFLKKKKKWSTKNQKKKKKNMAATRFSIFLCSSSSFVPKCSTSTFGFVPTLSSKFTSPFRAYNTDSLGFPRCVTKISDLSPVQIQDIIDQSFMMKERPHLFQVMISFFLKKKKDFDYLFIFKSNIKSFLSFFLFIFFLSIIFSWKNENF